jgi:ATP-binding cassette subfamily F protein 3
MRHAISLALQAFEGAMVIVSHDRHLLRSVTDEFYLVAHQKVDAFKGDLEDYRDWINDQKKQEAQQNVSVTSVKKLSGNLVQNKKEQKRIEAEKRKRLQPLKNKLSKLEKQLDTLNHEKEASDILLADAGIYEDSKKEQLKTLLEQQVTLTQSLAIVEEEWMLLSEELEEAQ